MARLVLDDNGSLLERREPPEVADALEGKALRGEPRGRCADLGCLEGRRHLVGRGSQRVGPHHDGRRLVQGERERFRLLGPQTRPPSLDEPRRVRRPEGEGLDGVHGRRRGPRSRLPREGAEDAVHERGRPRGPPLLGDLHRLVDRGPRRDPVEERELVRREPEERPHPRSELIQRASRRAGEHPVEPALPAERAERQLRGEAAIARLEARSGRRAPRAAGPPTRSWSRSGRGPRAPRRAPRRAPAARGPHARTSAAARPARRRCGPGQAPGTVAPSSAPGASRAPRR